MKNISALIPSRRILPPKMKQRGGKMNSEGFFFIEMETDDFSKKRGNFKKEAALQRKPTPRTERTAVFPILFLHVLFSAHPQD